MAMVQPVDMAVKANEILARFRPIAPKPAALLPASPPAAADVGAAATSRVLCHLQSRPCRARKRGRPSVVPAVSPAPPAAPKRKREVYPAPPLRCAAPCTDAAVATATRARVSMAVPDSACLSLASFSPPGASAGEPTRLSPKVAVAVAVAVAVEEEEEEEARGVPVERDLLRKLLEPKVISPRAVRPVGSTIHVESVDVHGGDIDVSCTAASKTAGEVEVELETEARPVVVTDSNNRVRLVNDAYKQMVGAPECPWLDALAAAASRRICGEVALLVAEHATLPETSTRAAGFSCTAKIEWDQRDGTRASVRAPCDVSRLQCESRDYLFAWRFRTGDASSVSHGAVGA